MAHNMKDIPASILVTEGTNVKTGLLSILEKKGVKILKSTDYQLNPLYWRLVSYAGQTYLLGYTRQLAGAKATKKLLVKGCSIDMNLPEKVVVSPHSNESFLCIQCGTKIIFLKAENKRQRNKWVDAIQSAIKEPIYYPSTVSTTSTDSSDSFDVLRDRDQRLPQSVRNTTDTAPRPGADWRRVNTSHAGQFQTTNRASLLSIPSSAHALAQQRRRSEEMASSVALQSQQSAIHSLNSADRMRSLSLRELTKPAIYDDDAKYTECEVVDEFEVSPSKPLSLSMSMSTSLPTLRVQDSVPGKVFTNKSRYRHSEAETKAFHQTESSYDVHEPGYEPITCDDQEDLLPRRSPSDMPDENFYMPLQNNDDQYFVSSVYNLGLENEGICDDTAAPELSKRDYQNPTSVVHEGLRKNKSSKKTGAPQSFEVPIDQMDFIEREKTVCLEIQFQRDHQPIGRDNSDDDNEKKMRGKIHSEAANGESLLAYIQGTKEAEKNDYDNFLEKTQSDGTDSVEPIVHALDGKSATGKFGARGGKLSTKSHGLTLYIPPGALEEGEKISLIVLTDIPEGLTLNTDELLVSHGFQCYPSGLRFKKPAKLIIPHCALVTAPNNIKTILYSWNQSGTPKRLSDPDNIICSVQERWLEVSISHFSGGFIALIRDWLFVKGILLSCMSFLPRFMPPSRRPVLEVRFVKKPHDQKWKDVHTLDDPGFRPVKGDDDDIVLQKGTLRVTCQLGEKGPKSDVPTIQDSDMMLETKVTGYIMLDLTEESDETLVTLEVVHTSTQTIKFNTRFQALGIGERVTEPDTPSPSIAEIPSDGQKVTDKYILDIARRLPADRWRHLHVALCIEYCTAEGIRDKYRDITDGYVHLLHKWRAASTRTRNDLEAILKEVEAGGLVNNNEPPK